VWDQGDKLEVGSPASTFPGVREVLCREDKQECMKTMWRKAVTVSHREYFTYQQRRWAEEVGLGI
jgi:hypothetical protein